jgi:RNA polymerase sigma-70 factor (ECF subfamily)
MREADFRAFIDAGSAAWPSIHVSDDDFARHVSERLLGGSLPPLEHAGDLYLACACALRSAGAVDAFHVAHGEVIARVLARRGAAADVADDAVQALNERLFVAEPPKIGEYAGRGPLRSWVATAAATTLAMIRRTARRRREEPAAAEPDLAAAALESGPELRYMKERYSAEVRASIVRALEGLSDRDRALLRMHLGERLGIDRIGALYRIDRATAARWLARARDALVAAARLELRDRLKLSESQYHSIASLVRSELHVSIARLLGEKGPKQ